MDPIPSFYYQMTLPLNSNASPRDYQGSTAIIYDAKRPAGNGFVCFAVSPLHPEINEVWCPAELMQDAKCLVVLKNPNCSGYLPQVASVIQPVSTIFIAQVLWMRDFYKACKKGEREFPMNNGPGIFSMPKDYLDGFIDLSEFLNDDDFINNED